MNKDDLTQKIIDTMDELDKLGNGKAAALFLYGDIEEMITIATLKGNIKALAISFGHQMENNEQFNRVMMSMFGSFLSNNPEKKAMFLEGLKLSDFNIGVN